MTVKKLRETCLAAHNKTQLTKWEANKLIETLVESKKHAGRASKNHSGCLNQELTNIIISNMALKALDGDAKIFCQKGHDLKKTHNSFDDGIFQ